MKLYHAAASPFVRKVMVCLHETKQLDAVTLVPALGHPTDPGTMPVAHNPLGKLPTLVRDDGPALYDSRVICQYLSDRAGGALYPAAPRLWEALTLEATADGIMDAAVLMVYEGRSRSADKQDPAWVEAQWTKVIRALETLESRWMGYLAGPLDIGLIATGCALGYLDFRQPDRDWRASYPALDTWHRSFSERDSMRKTAPEG